MWYLQREREALALTEGWGTWWEELEPAVCQMRRREGTRKDLARGAVEVGSGAYRLNR